MEAWDPHLVLSKASGPGFGSAMRACTVGSLGHLGKVEGGPGITVSTPLLATPPAVKDAGLGVAARDDPGDPTTPVTPLGHVA